jgi:hypothetical protein
MLPKLPIRVVLLKKSRWPVHGAASKCKERMAFALHVVRTHCSALSVGISIMRNLMDFYAMSADFLDSSKLRFALLSNKALLLRKLNLKI